VLEIVKVTRTADTETLGSVIKQRTDLSKGASEALTECLVVLGNRDVIPRNYSRLLRWGADVRGAREGDKGSCLPQHRRNIINIVVILDHYHTRSVESEPKQYNFVSLGSAFLVIEPLSYFPKPAAVRIYQIPLLPNRHRTSAAHSRATDCP